MFEKKTKVGLRAGIGAVLGTAALALSMVPTTALAAYNNGVSQGTDIDDAALTKKVDNEDGAPVPAGTYKFTIAPYGKLTSNGGNVSNGAGTGENQNTYDTTIAASMPDPVGGTSQQVFVQASQTGHSANTIAMSQLLPTAASLGAAGGPGTYVYQITEDNLDTDLANLVDKDTNHEWIYITVGRDAEGNYTYTQFIVTENTTTTPGGPKQNPTKKIETDYGNTPVSDFDFQNKAKRTDNGGNSLEITKKVSETTPGSYDGSKFAIKVNLTLPGVYGYTNADGKHLDSITVNGQIGNTEQPFTLTWNGTNHDYEATDVEIHLGKDESLTFDKSALPVNATYQISEVVPTNYKASGAFTTSASATSTADGTEVAAGSTYTSNVHALTSGTAGINSFTLTNANGSVPPTGILINNAPMLVLIGVATAGIVVFAVNRKNREQE